MKRQIRKKLTSIASIATAACLMAAPYSMADSTEAATESDSDIPQIVADALNYDSQEEIIEAAIQRNESRTVAQTAWNGPTDGPKAQTGKKIAIIVADGGNAIQVDWGNYSAEACKSIGWDYVIMDGKGSAQTQNECVNQAISMKCDGIVLASDAEVVKDSLAKAEEAGIPTVGIHASSEYGPVEDVHLLNSITPEAYELGMAHVDYAIADNNGVGRVIILYDGTYTLAQKQAKAMEAMVNGVDSLELLDVINTPMATMSTTIPQMTGTWINTYGLDPENPIYVLTIADVYYDYAVPTLRSANADKNAIKLVASDGTQSGYERVRSDEYQVCTMPVPSELYGYMAIDDLNRYFAGEEQFTFTIPTYVVTKDNIADEGGDQDIFIPSNDYVNTYKGIWGVE